MKLNNEDFDLMLNAAWSAFENTLFLWGMTKADIEVFEELMDKWGGYNKVEAALLDTVELENK